MAQEREIRDTISSEGDAVCSQEEGEENELLPKNLRGFQRGDFKSLTCDL